MPEMPLIKMSPQDDPIVTTQGDLVGEVAAPIQAYENAFSANTQERSVFPSASSQLLQPRANSPVYVQTEDRSAIFAKSALMLGVIIYFGIQIFKRSSK